MSLPMVVMSSPLLMVCSSGGHFQASYQLAPYWRQQERVWVTFKSISTESKLQGETVYWAWSPTNRNLPNFFRNLVLAWSVLRREKPRLILSTGAGVAVPFLILGRLLGIRTIFIESITRIETLSLSARLSLPFLDALYVHWPALKAQYPKAELVISPLNTVRSL